MVGRESFAGCQTERGTRVAALFYSLLMSAVQEGVAPHAYLMAAAEQGLWDPGSVLLPAVYAEQRQEPDSE